MSFSPSDNFIHGFCSFFIDKTKIMVFSTSRTAENVHFLYNEKEIETVTEFNYLGVTFTKNGKFKLAYKFIRYGRQLGSFSSM
jgi:hypothetical protein